MSSYITVVSGLPRTGTSMMMRMLEAGGMPMVVDNVRQADIDNPGGYYEFEKVKEIKEDMSWLMGAEGKAFKMVSMLLCELPGEREYRIIFMERDMSEMLASQRKMLERLGRGAVAGDDVKAGALYLKHLGEIKGWLAGQKNMEVLYVSYNDVLDRPRENARAINRFLGGGLDEEKMAGALDRDLYRNRAEGLPAAGLKEDAGVTEDEDELIKEKLKGLGYL